MSKNEFLEQYIEVPEKGVIRYSVFSASLLINIVNFMVLYLYKISILKQYFWDKKMYVFLAVLVLLDVWGLLIFIFPRKLSGNFYLYMAVAFTGTSLYYLYTANAIIFYDFGIRSLLFMIISIIIYIMTFTTVIFNIVSKINKGKRYIINNRNTAIVAIIGGIIGIILPKPNFNNNHLPLVVILLILSYLFTFMVSGFHKFYLGHKMKLVKIKSKEGTD